MRKVWDKITDRNLRKKWGKWNSCPPGPVRLATALSTYNIFPFPTNEKIKQLEFKDWFSLLYVWSSLLYVCDVWIGVCKTRFSVGWTFIFSTCHWWRYNVLYRPYLCLWRHLGSDVQIDVSLMCRFQVVMVKIFRRKRYMGPRWLAAVQEKSDRMNHHRVSLFLKNPIKIFLSKSSRWSKHGKR